MKSIYRLIILAVVLTPVLSISASAQEKKPGVEVRKVAPLDNTIVEEWVRVTTEEDVLGVDASRGKEPKWNWRITVNAAEFVRKDPLASRLQTAVESALKKVKGVRQVAHEDREVWLVQGDASGEELIRACSAAVDGMAEDIRKLLKSP